MRKTITALLVWVPLVSSASAMQQPDPLWAPELFSGLELRSIGPALTSGRIGDIAVNPKNPKEYFVAAASGGVWKTENSGTTWTPVFDRERSYSIGCITIDPKNPLVVWVGSGENNSQRSVSYGDGVYKSVDGGRTWKNVGLETSEHVGKILIDPRDSDTVFVAAQGPLWRSGGDRGLYRTTDGGKTWRRVLHVSDDTGVTDLVMDPRDPDVLIAASYQRRRHVWTLIDGGPESALYKSTDGGESWEKLNRGLPRVDLGRIGLALSPARPDVVYAIIEAAQGEGGFFRSIDMGSHWEKRSGYVSGSPQYYQELVADPEIVDRVYSMDTYLMVTEDGGRTFRRLGGTFKHVDDHALWIDPEDTSHLLAGGDGGLYESFDRGATWEFKPNLPLTQFYRVSVDGDFPFYNVYGGTQDNFSLGGPSRTTTVHGITNADWFVTRGGDGFESQIDPEDPNIIYAQSQHGGLVRFDKRSGESIYIQPQPGREEEGLKWNWDSPLIISPHSAARLYFAANRLYRSDDRGNTWRAVSPDLTRRIDRNQLPVMGRTWGIDTVALHSSTSMYGNIVALSESPRREGLLYVGTDDGLIQVTADGGESWVEADQPPDVPPRTYVSRIEASRHDEDTLYAAFDNHKMGDFKPYVFKSTDRGKTWVSIASNLSENGPVYALAEDPVEPDLLFAGTEFGVFFTVDGGGRWVRLEGGMPTIAVRDLAIQEREVDLVLATFGRGFYILDDYSPLRHVTSELLEKEAFLFPVKRAWMYMESSPLGLPGKAFQGHSFYTAPNPPFGAVFTYFLREDLKTSRQRRWEAERKIVEEGGNVPFPTLEESRAEEMEEEPAVFLVVTDQSGEVVRRLKAPVKKGFHRVGWDLRYPSSEPTRLAPPEEENPFASPPRGPMVVPGSYRVALVKSEGGRLTALGEPQTFETEPLGTASLPAEDRAALHAFQKKTAELQRAVLGAVAAVDETAKRIEHIRQAIVDTPSLALETRQQARALALRLEDLRESLSGDPVLRRRYEPQPPSITGRVQGIVRGHWTSTSAPTWTHLEDYEMAAEQFERVLEDLRRLVEVDLRALEESLDSAGAPWTPGRLPRWRR